MQAICDQIFVKNYSHSACMFVTNFAAFIILFIIYNSIYNIEISLRQALNKTCYLYIDFDNTNLQIWWFHKAPKPVGRRARKPGIDRKPRQAYSAKQLEKLEGEFKVI